MTERINAITMPKLGLSMTEGAVTEWHVELGDEISPGQVIADIETSKIVNELEANVSGQLRRTSVELGIEVPVGALIGVVADANVPDTDIDDFIASYGNGDIAQAKTSATAEVAAKVPVEQVEAVTEAVSPTEVPESLRGDYDPQAVFATHHAHKLAQRLGINLAAVTGTGRRGRASRRDLETAVKLAGGSVRGAEEGPPLQADAGKVRTTPMAKRLADEHGIDLLVVSATGTRGRITKGDVLRHLQQPGDTPAAGPSTALPVSTSNPYKEETLGSARRIIASRLSESKNTAPHYRLSVDVIVDKLLELRRDIGQGDTAARVSVNDMLVRATALALAEHPDVNIQFDGQTIRSFTHADIAVAVAADAGLITPIIRNADQKGLMVIAAEVAELADRAREGKLLPDEFQGGTFTLSNLGMFGVKSFDAIINPPQAAIMAIGKAEQRLYVDEEESGRVATFMTVTLSCDHRVIDGAMGAKFLETFKDILHHPGRLLLEP